MAERKLVAKGAVAAPHEEVVAPRAVSAVFAARSVAPSPAGHEEGTKSSVAKIAAKAKVVAAAAAVALGCSGSQPVVGSDIGDSEAGFLQADSGMVSDAGVQSDVISIMDVAGAAEVGLNSNDVSMAAVDVLAVDVPAIAATCDSFGGASVPASSLASLGTITFVITPAGSAFLNPEVVPHGVRQNLPVEFGNAVFGATVVENIVAVEYDSIGGSVARFDERSLTCAPLSPPVSVNVTVPAAGMSGPSPSTMSVVVADPSSDAGTGTLTFQGMSSGQIVIEGGFYQTVGVTISYAQN